MDSVDKYLEYDDDFDDSDLDGSGPEPVEDYEKDAEASGLVPDEEEVRRLLLNYSECKDTDRSKAGQIEDILLRKYENYIKFLVRNILKKNILDKTLLSKCIQAGRLGLWKSIDKFDLQRGVKFISYARTSITREVIYEINQDKSKYNKNRRNNVIDRSDEDDPWTTKVNVKDDDSGYVADISLLPEKKVRNDVDVYMAKIEGILNNKDADGVSEIDKDIVRYYYGLSGYDRLNLTEMAKISNLSVETIRQRHLIAINKIKNIIDNAERRVDINPQHSKPAINSSRRKIGCRLCIFYTVESEGFDKGYYRMKKSDNVIDRVTKFPYFNRYCKLKCEFEDNLKPKKEVSTITEYVDNTETASTRGKNGNATNTEKNYTPQKKMVFDIIDDIYEQNKQHGKVEFKINSEKFILFKKNGLHRGNTAKYVYAKMKSMDKSVLNINVDIVEESTIRRYIREYINRSSLRNNRQDSE